MTYDDYVTAIGTLIPGSDLPLDDQHFVQAINKALKLHAKYKPRRIVEDIAAVTGTRDYALSALAAWDSDFGQVLQVEYPVDETDPGANLLDRHKGDWTIYIRPTGPYLRIVSAIPVTGDTIRVTYTGLHQVDGDGQLTVAAADDEAVQTLAAAFACRILAAAYAQNQDSTIQADAVDQSSKRREYEAQAKRYRAEYDELMGVEPGKPQAATGVKNLDLDGPYLTHPVWTR